MNCGEANTPLFFNLVNFIEHMLYEHISESKA
jgi:hypothetical protein